MKYMTLDEIRDMWLRFFQERGSHVEKSASLIPDNDPSLLFINAGVAALKKYFDGRVTPPYRRLVNAQKCIRTNDIENVGRTDRHHTFFEMLGNFSIGDYFRNEAIPWAYELLTSEKWFGLPKEKLYVTYYPGDAATRDLWIKCGIAPDHLIPSQDNFWEIGEGPCGPDTEINFDRGEKYDPKGLGVKLISEGIENDRFIELWNIVFSQFNAKPGLKREDYPELPHKNIDTGASLERFACVMQGTESNFEIDTFKPIVEKIEKASGKPYQGEWKMAYRVVADHTRCLVFALADGCLFSNEGRGYVLRRILRRAERFAKALGLPDGFLSKLVPAVVETNDHFYPYLKEKQSKVAKTILAEEERFASTLKTGEKLLSDFLQKDGDVLSAAHAFKLSDTYGFPFELTREIVSDRGKKVDEKGYAKLLEQQRERARKARDAQGIIAYGSQHKDLMEFTKPSTFLYEDKVIKAKVIGTFKDGVKVKEIKDEGAVAFDRTTFYAEQGGQVADTGTIQNDTTEADVTDCQHAPNKQNLAFVKVRFGSVKVGDTFTLKPDFQTRSLTRKNHSACHLLHQALSDVLNGNTAQIAQEGSLVGPHVCRLDFAFERKLTQDELDLIEADVNERIQRKTPCVIEYMDKEEAMKLPAYHQFAAKYGATVRVVKMGDAEEFCGGTHVSNTEDINLFAIVSEQAISSGVRRIVAVTGKDAYEYLKGYQRDMRGLSSLLSVSGEKDVTPKVKSVLQADDLLRKDVRDLKEKVASASKAELADRFTSLQGVDVLVASKAGLDHAQLNSLVSSLAHEHPAGVVFIASQNKGGRIDLAVGVGALAQKKGLKAGDLVKRGSELLGGRGGGRSDVAFGSATSLEKLSEVEKLIEGSLRG